MLAGAANTVLKERPGVHGSAEQSFEMIGDMWTVYTRHSRKVRGFDTIRPEDVAQMMVMLKQARAVYGDTANADNFVDEIGYAALAGMLQLPDPSKEATDNLEALDPQKEQRPPRMRGDDGTGGITFPRAPFNKPG